MSYFVFFLCTDYTLNILFHLILNIEGNYYRCPSLLDYVVMKAYVYNVTWPES